MAQNTPNFFKHRIIFYPSIQVQLGKIRIKMDYLDFPQENLNEYVLRAFLLDHSKISQNHRARLFSWLSEECSKQKLSRYAYALTCTYIDLFFMKKNDVSLEDYQLLALGALILATKKIQIEGKVPIIDINLFNVSRLLEMEKRIILTLNYYLNPPIYIELLNNIAKMWDTRCESGQINSNVRYFKQHKDSYLRLKTIYEKMDCLYLFKKILNYDIQDVVLTLFYVQTKIFDQELKDNSSESQTSSSNGTISLQNSQQINNFDSIFGKFLEISGIDSGLNKTIEKMASLLTKDKFPINDVVPAHAETFTQLLSYQTHNKSGHSFYKKNQANINNL